MAAEINPNQLPVIAYRRIAHPIPRGYLMVGGGPNGDVRHDLPDQEYEWEIEDSVAYFAVYNALPQEMQVILKNESNLTEIPVFGLGHVVNVRGVSSVRHWWSSIKVHIPPGESVVMTSSWLQDGIKDADPNHIHMNPIIL